MGIGEQLRHVASGRRGRLALALVALSAVMACGGAMAVGEGGSTSSAGPGRLTDEMSARVQAAINAADEAGVELVVTSGWRSPEYQQELLDEAIAEYGSREEATHWVLPPEDSAHVQGTAVDVGPKAGMAWLDQHGAEFGLCRRYDNEPWHFEPLTEPGGSCPPREPHAVAHH